MFSPSKTHNNIAIFGSPRSGSTFVFHNLVSGLVSEYTQYSTEFNRKRLGSEPFRNDIKDSWKNFPDNYWIAKFHLLDIINADRVGIVKEVIEKTHYKILLLRKNLWESALSMSISEHKNQWINNLDNNKITISPDLFKRMLEVQVRNINHFCGNNDFDITFDQILFTEELTNNPADMYENITGSRLTIHNEIKKSPSKEDIVININELRVAYEEADKELHGAVTLEGDMVNYNE